MVMSLFAFLSEMRLDDALSKAPHDKRCGEKTPVSARRLCRLLPTFTCVQTGHTTVDLTPLCTVELTNAAEMAPAVQTPNMPLINGWLNEVAT
jgi:hypothetical protein